MWSSWINRLLMRGLLRFIKIHPKLKKLERKPQLRFHEDVLKAMIPIPTQVPIFPDEQHITRNRAIQNGLCFLVYLGMQPPPPSSLLLSTGEPNATPNLASTILSTASPAMTQRHSTHFLAPTMTMRNRTKSDSALLATASATAPSGTEAHGDGKSKVQTK